MAQKIKNFPAKETMKASMQDACDPEHYKGMRVEVIDILEDFVSQPSTLSQKQRLCVAQALRYLLRAGRKGIADIDLQKAENYIHRALTGQWIDREFLGGK